MLLEKTLQPDDICTLKLITGEEVIAKLIELTTSHIVITKPLVLNLGMDQQSGQYQLQMLPTFIFSGRPDAKLKISLSHVITVTPSEDNAKTNYTQNTTGLAVPKSQG